MTIENLLNLITQTVFLLVACSTLFNWARQRDQAHFDIALVFVSLAITIIARYLQRILPAQTTLLTLVFFVALLTQPYLLLRVAQYFQPVPLLVRRAALGGLILIFAALFLIETEPTLVFIPAIGYFMVLESYASFLFVRGAVTFAGISGQRLKFASLGSGLLALIFFLALGFVLVGNVTAIPSSLQSLVSALIQVLAIFSGLSYYLGFSSPRWLRHSWQLRELHNFLQHTSGRVTQDYHAVISELSEAALRTVGGTTAVIAICDAKGVRLTIESAGQPPLQIENLENLPDAIGQAWREKKARVARLLNETSPEVIGWGKQFGARALLIVPILSPLRPWGLLIVALRYAPLFARDDLDLLTLLVEQSAISLDFTALVSETQRAGESKFRTLFETMSEGFSINEIICDETGKPYDLRYLEVNPAFEHHTGLKTEDILGRTTLELFPNAEPIWFERYGKVALTGEPAHFEAQFGPLSKWFEVNAYQTEPNRFAVVFFDITERKRAEEELKYSEEMLNAIIEQSPLSIQVLSKDGTCIRVNSAWEELWGLRSEQIIGYNLLTDPQIKESGILSYLEKAFSGEIAFIPPVYYDPIETGLAGKARWTTAVAYPVKDITGQVQEVVLTHQDITDRKRAEEDIRTLNEELEQRVNERTLALQESEERYRTLFESIDEGFCIIEMIFDEQEKPVDYRFMIVNPAFEKQTGLIDAQGKTMRWFAPNHEEYWFEIYGRIAVTGEPARFENRAEQLHRWYDVYALRSGKPEKRQVAILFNDITERKQAEAEVKRLNHDLEQRQIALSEANNLLQTLMDNMPDHIYFKDRKSRFIRNSRSQAKMMGMNDPAEVIGKTDFDFFPQPHAQRSYDEEQNLIKSGLPIIDMEERVVWPDGRVTWVSSTKLPLRDAQGKITGTFGISRDITERKQAEEELQDSNSQLDAANKELEAFSYSVSHDLRAPLRSIDGFSQALLEDYGDQIPGPGVQYLNRVRTAAQHMADLIDDLLNLSRVTRAPMKSEAVNLSALAEKIVNDLQHTEPERSPAISITPGLEVTGDSQLLHVVLMNLLGNAWKFTSKKEESRIEFGTEAGPDETIFFVRDNGAGFDMTYADKLFGAFQRLHTMQEFPGTGVGLATVKRIITRHGGKIWAKSTPDEGATFYFTL